MYDVIVIGAGVTGCAVAMELAKKDRRIAVIEKNSDVCEGTSKANSGIVHAGYDAVPGSLKARLNVRGNELMGELAQRLDFPFKRNGSIVLCFDDKDRPALNKLYEQGIANGVRELRIIEKDELQQIEPEISDDAVAALYAPTGGIVCPFNLTIAMAENACVNGVDFILNTPVTEVRAVRGGYQVVTATQVYDTKIVINAAGVYAAAIHRMVSSEPMHIIPRKGEYCLMDKKVGTLVSHTIFQLPTRYGKGVLVTPTVHGNLLVGPNANDVSDYEAVNTTADGLADVTKRAALSVRELPGRSVITSFAGLRAHEEKGDFIIKEPEDAKGFIDVAGIESPGLTCAPAIGEYVAGLVNDIAPAADKDCYIAVRKGIPQIAALSSEEQSRLIAENPAYANVICRCEMVTEGEIVDSIRRPLGATTLDGVKRRTRAGMGRCQAGFCSPKTVEILSRELNVSPEEITKCGGESHFIVGMTKEDLR